MNEFGLVTVTCQIAKAVLSCQWYSLGVFYYQSSNVGEVVDIGVAGDNNSLILQVVPT